MHLGAGTAAASSSWKCWRRASQHHRLAPLFLHQLIARQCCMALVRVLWQLLNLIYCEVNWTLNDTTLLRLVLRAFLKD